MITLVYIRVIASIRWHQVLIAKLIPHVVRFADSISPTELELEDLLLWLFINWIRKSVVTVGKLLRFNKVLVVVSATLCILSSCMI